jgi:predicted RNase H-like nuclease (RuvC/YqgF family)
MASEHQADVEVKARAAIEQLLTGDVPEGLKCDVKSLCLLARVLRATPYRTYPQLKAEFEQRHRGVQAAGREPDPRLAQIQRLKTELLELRTRLERLNTETTELKTLRAVALSRLRSDLRKWAQDHR